MGDEYTAARDAPSGLRLTCSTFARGEGTEVDFVLSVGREHWAIEVRASRHVDARDPKGLEGLQRARRQDQSTDRRFFGAGRQRIDGAEVLPIEDFLAELPDYVSVAPIRGR